MQTEKTERVETYIKEEKHIGTGMDQEQINTINEKSLQMINSL